jgi:hypothetical protein
MRLKFLVPLVLLGSSMVAVAQAPANEKNAIVTTLAGVEANVGAEGFTVYADVDNRLFVTSPRVEGRIEELRSARKNGWEVELVVEETANKGILEIVDFRIRARENKLTTGFQADRTFKPLVVKSRTDIRSVFDAVYPYNSDNYDANDNCFNRAQYWSRAHQVLQQEQSKTFGTDKVFIFFTQAYIRKYKHKWWYHVAPMIYQETSTGKESWVLDPTFLSGPVPLKGATGWLAAFDSHTSGKCEKIETLDDYYENNDRPVCMYIVASMFNYSPSDLTENKLTNWRCYDFERMTSAIDPPGKNTNRPNASWKSAENRKIIPEMCRR